VEDLDVDELEVVDILLIYEIHFLIPILLYTAPYLALYFPLHVELGAAKLREIPALSLRGERKSPDSVRRKIHLNVIEL